MTDEILPQNLSRHQYKTLRFIVNHDVTMRTLRKAHGTTLGSLGLRGLLRRVGPGDDAKVMVTDAGLIALASYNEDKMNERKSDHDLTDRCLRLIQHSRRLNVLQKGAA